VPEQDFQNLEILLMHQIQTTAAQTTLTLSEAIARMKASGMSNEAIREVLLNDLNTGGRLFGQFKNAVKSTVSGAIGRAGVMATVNTYKKAGVKKARWITAGVNVCPDCRARHNLEGTMEFFENIGMPKSGFSVCQDNCNCTLVEISYKGENLDGPLIREKKN
jgi:hypothetical protein